MYRVKGKFITQKNYVRRSNVIGSIQSRTLPDISSDHIYLAPSYTENPPVTDHHQVPDVAKEEWCCDGKSWRDGRVIIEIGVLADGLSGCMYCGLPLSLSSTLHVKTCGLASVLSVKCLNTACQKVNKIDTGKKHGKVFDVNTKAATAMIHAGIGERQFNSILAALNIQTVSHGMLDARQKEVGMAVEEVAKLSVGKSLIEEASLDKEGHHEIIASVDAGWQKRGSGRSYNSLSGHCTMIGNETGKVVGYTVRSKQCRKCDRGMDHQNCRKNWTGSAKAMEADMVMELVKTTATHGVRTKAIIGDDDSATISKLRNYVDSNIDKISDRNHVKKTISNSLYKLRKHFPTLTPTVITGLMKNFNYMLVQNTGNENGIYQGLCAVVSHPFADHSWCGNWCGFVTKKKTIYNSLPYGKPLNDSKLKTALLDLIRLYQKHASKLCQLGSTQANESMNRLIASKAPKTNHYSGSASFNYRCAAGVAQKNMGEQYVLDVHNNIGISPGSITKKSFALRDIQRKRRKALAVTSKAKRRKVILKNQRCKSQGSTELREGPSYDSNLELNTTTDENMEIPPAMPKPSAETLKLSNYEEVFFDLETTGLDRTSHITQLAARRGDDIYNTYILPKKEISNKASEVTNIYLLGNQMYHGSSIVDSAKISTALDDFIKFLSFSNNNVLIGHNVKSFDSIILMNSLYACNKVELFLKNCIGFIDTKIMFRKAYPDCKSYSQAELVKLFLKTGYNAHDAVEDVNLLQKLVHKASVGIKYKQESSFCIQYCCDMQKYLTTVHENLPSLNCLTSHKVISADMAKRIAGSGLTFTHLLVAFKRQGYLGVDSLLSEMCSNNTVRVTRSQKVIGKIVDFLSQT